MSTSIWTSCLATAACVTALLIAPAAAHANGGNSHSWISVEARRHLPDGTLAELLARPELQSMLINGSVFPDGGYVVGDEYGEMAHWEPFVDAYLRWLRDHFEPPYTTGEAAQHVAFLMGVASHGMADQTYDSMFMAPARVHDAANWSDELLTSFDTATDVFLVAETGMSFRGEAWVPDDEVSEIYARYLDYDISPGQLRTNQDLLQRLVLNYAAVTANDPVKVAEFYAQYPWAGANMMDDTYAGGPPCEGEIVAAYWLALWDRLHEVYDQQNVVIATHPHDGGAGHPTDHTIVESQVIVVFGHGIPAAQVAGKFEVRDGADHVYDVEIAPWSSDVTNVVRLRPREDWAADEDITVTIKPGIAAMDGLTLEAPLSFTFSTRATPTRDDPSSDPTPHDDSDPSPPLPDAGPIDAGVIDAGEAAATDGGAVSPGEAGGCCQASDGAAAPAALLGLGVLLVTLRRRRRA